MLMDLPLNTTQLVGILAFAMACWAAWRAARFAALHADASSTTWRWISTLQFLYGLEVWLGTRHAAHDLVNAVLQATGLYAGRDSIQRMMLVVTVLTGMVAGGVMWQSHWWSRQSNMRAKLALVCTAAVLLLFLIETISLHAIDRVLYRPIGPVLLIAYAWAANGIAVTWLARRPAA
jgi:hypothetical protein